MPKKKVLDEQTVNADWYMKDAKADAIKGRLGGRGDGEFAIRNSSSQPGNFVLAYNTGGATKNLHVDGEDGKIKLSKSTKKFDCISDLVRYYCENDTTDLACKLSDMCANLGPVIDAKAAKKLAKERAKAEKAALKRPPSSPPSGGGGSGSRDAKGAQWKVQDVCDWLESMEMREYAPTFKKNKVDGAALLMLNDNDLRELGVGAFGARKKLVQAIDTLNKKFRAMETGEAPAPPGMNDGAPPPVTTIGLIARNINGQVKIFDIDTNEEVQDIAAHQKRKQEELANGTAPPPRPPAPQQRNFGPTDHELEAWYDKTLPKAKIHALLEPLPNGNFVIRDSNTNPGCYTFSMVCNGKVQSKLIEKDGGGLHFKSSTDVFPNLSALVDNYTRTTGDILQCGLVYPDEGSRGMSISALPYWNCLDLDKESALSKIRGKAAGAFVIRPSDKSYAALSLVKPDGSMYNQHIEQTGRGLQLKKSTVAHADLVQFVAYYSTSSQQDLPCPLVANL